jgi:hypothetical protein
MIALTEGAGGLFPNSVRFAALRDALILSCNVQQCAPGDEIVHRFGLNARFPGAC